MNNLEAKLLLSKALFRGVVVIHAIAFRKTKYILRMATSKTWNHDFYRGLHFPFAFDSGNYKVYFKCVGELLRKGKFSR